MIDILKHPILFGLIGGVITYLILHFDTRFENRKFNNNNQTQSSKCSCPQLYTTLKVPLIIGALTWVMASYFEECKDTIAGTNDLENSLSIFDQDMFTDVPEF